MVGIDKWNRMLAKVTERVDVLAPDAKETLNGGMDISWEEHYAYQNQQTQAHARGLISAEVAQAVYSSLGEAYSENNGGWANTTNLATKCLVTQLMSELLGMAVARSGR